MKPPRGVPSFTLEGLKARLDQMERHIANLHRRGNWNYDLDREFPIAATYSGKVKQTGSVNVAHATYTKITFDAEVHDNADMVDLTTNNDRITITKGGYYLLTAEITFQANTTGERQVLISKNGGPYPAGTLLSAPAVDAISTQTHVLTATQAELVPGDYLTLGAYQSSGATLGVGGSHGDTNLTVTLLGLFADT